MQSVPYRRRFRFADGERTIVYHQNLPRDVLLGVTPEHGRHFVLTDADRAAHIYICGITGSGKTRCLENMIIQDIINGQPLCLIDPTHLLYDKTLDFVAYATEHAAQLNHNQEDLLDRFLFLDIDSDSNPLRINPLAPDPVETTEEQIDDLLKVAERLFGDIDEMRRLRNVLRSAFWITVELNKLAAARNNAPPAPLLAAYRFPLNLDFVTDFLLLDSDQKKTLLGCLPEHPDNRFPRQYWESFFSQFSGSQQAERLESSLNIIQYFVGDALVRRFFDIQESTLHIPTVMRRRQSLLCAIPLGKNLKGGQLIGAYLATKFQRVAYRRPVAERSPYSLYIDEFHEFADIEFAKAATTLRQYQLRLINAHQSQSQPPFHTPEGQSILDTIKGNSRVKLLFRLTREDAERMSKELFELSQRRFHFSYEERSLALGESASTTSTVSYQESRSTALSWTRADSVAIAETDSFGIAKTEGVNLGKTLTQGFGDSIAEGISQTITETNGETLTETISKAHGINLLSGDNWSHLVNHNTGFTFTQTDKESLAVQRGMSESETETEQQSNTQSAGRSYQVTDGQGDSLTRTQGQVAHYITGIVSRNEGQALGYLRNHAESDGRNYQQAVSQIRGTSQAVSHSLSDTATHGQDKGFSREWGTTRGGTAGGMQQHGHSETDSVAESRAKLRQFAKARGENLTLSRHQEQSLAHAFQQLKQFSENYGRALQQTVSRTDTQGRTEQVGFTQGKSFAEGKSYSETETVAERKVFLSLEGEREITINDLQKLSQGHCVVTKQALSSLLLETYFIPDAYYAYRFQNLPARILQRQREKLMPSTAPAPTYEDIQPQSVSPNAPPEENSPWNL